MVFGFVAQDLDLEKDAASRQAYAKQISDYFAWVKQLQQKRCASAIRLLAICQYRQLAPSLA
jgi:hypothetical protein